MQLTPAGRQFLGTAQVTLAQLTDARQTIRAAEHSKLPQQRIAALHAISVNYLQPRLSEFAKQIPEMRVRVVSDTMAACCQLLTDGGCEFLLYYRHQHVEPILDETRFARKDICNEDLIPVAQQNAAVRNGWTLGGPSQRAVPYLSYDPDTFSGKRRRPHGRGGGRHRSMSRYMDALAEALKRQALRGQWGGVAPRLLHCREELADGRLVRMGGPSWTARLTISLFCFAGSTRPGRTGAMGGVLTPAHRLRG